ncbi:MAG: hypothetical protein IAF02_15710 [Anaerolineae bacterium]|nr:hypothetical protein [Anaerolineae bacterium]
MTIVAQLNPEAFTAEYDELRELAAIEPIQKPEPTPITKPEFDYPTLRRHYQNMTLRERVELNRQAEASKHAAYCNNRLATKGQKLLQEAIKKQNQPKQLSLF